MSQAADNDPNDWVKLPDQALHVVRASMQKQAKNILSKKALVKMSDEDIGPYLQDGENVSQEKFLYVIRAAAFYVNEKYELPKPAFRRLPFNVSFSPSRDLLVVVNFALGYAGTKPTNLALVIESPKAVRGSEAICLRTQ
jgi:hypothetical protein